MPSTGTVNAIYRLGDRLYARLPRVQAWAPDLDKEWQWLPKLAPRLSLRIPDPVAKGHPTSSYPFSWAIYRWISAPWEYALQAPAWNGTPVWIHSDLLRPNLLVQDGRLYAVIDFGGVGVGDPAADVIAAWSVFSQAGRGTFRAALEVDDGTWNRARGFALHQAALIILYYGETNPGFVAPAKRTIEEALADIHA